MFHRIEDPKQLDSARYYRLAELLPSYDGAVRRAFERILYEAQQQKEGSPAPQARPARVATNAGAEVLAAKSEAGSSRFPSFEYRK